MLTAHRPTRSSLKAKSLLRKTLLPFCIAAVLFLLVLICLKALMPTNKQPRNELQGIFTIL
jgi:hypothetical protein